MHHRAKLTERTEFIRRIIEKGPKTICDLGCGPGIWLELFNEYADIDCKFIGIDTDQASIDNSRKRSRNWSRPVELLCADIETESYKLPAADVYIAFNIFPYLNDIGTLLKRLKKQVNPGGSVVVRQYDGALLRFGPMSTNDRTAIDISLQSSVLRSEEFKHYDLDRVFEAIKRSDFLTQHIEFEVFKRISPYPPQFIPYLENTINWMLQYLSEDAGEILQKWKTHHQNTGYTSPSYFSGTDMIAWLS